MLRAARNVDLIRLTPQEVAYLASCGPVELRAMGIQGRFNAEDPRHLHALRATVGRTQSNARASARAPPSAALKKKVVVRKARRHGAAAGGGEVCGGRSSCACCRRWHVAALGAVTGFNKFQQVLTGFYIFSKILCKRYFKIVWGVLG